MSWHSCTWADLLLCDSEGQQPPAKGIWQLWPGWPCLGFPVSACLKATFFCWPLRVHASGQLGTRVKREEWLKPSSFLTKKGKGTKNWQRHRDQASSQEALRTRTCRHMHTHSGLTDGSTHLYLLLRDIYHCRLPEAYTHRQGHFHAKTHVA